MFPALYKYLFSLIAIKPFIKAGSNLTISKYKWLPLIASLTLTTVLTACHQPITAQKDAQVGNADNANINIVSPDWGNAATLTAMGYPPDSDG